MKDIYTEHYYKQARHLRRREVDSTKYKSRQEFMTRFYSMHVKAVFGRRQVALPSLLLPFLCHPPEIMHAKTVCGRQLVAFPSVLLPFLCYPAWNYACEDCIWKMTGCLTFCTVTFSLLPRLKLCMWRLYVEDDRLLFLLYCYRFSDPPPEIMHVKTVCGRRLVAFPSVLLPILCSPACNYACEGCLWKTTGCFPLYLFSAPPPEIQPVNKFHEKKRPRATCTVHLNSEQV